MALSVFDSPAPMSSGYRVAARYDKDVTPPPPMRGPLNKEQRVIPDELDSASREE